MIRNDSIRNNPMLASTKMITNAAISDARKLSVMKSLATIADIGRAISL